ncbi:virB8 family protein [Sphingomonas sp. RB1R13]|uniref:virB8 family protein n=1 Tax=Sphingomonas sp. RB1R13 TaxID=3096159 RepID=UPI002FC76466
MNKPLPDLDEYFAEARSWGADRTEALRAQLKTAWRVAIAIFVIALCEAVALILLTPLKTVIPYTLLVDKHTGYVQLLKPLDQDRMTADAALTQSFLVQYVIAREEYDINAVQSDYRKVALWSSGNARSAYLSSMQGSNPDSPLVRLSRNAVVEVQVKSVASLSPNTAIVRFDTVRADDAALGANRQNWMAVVGFEFRNQAMSAEDRMINPLGFKVIRYRKSSEALPQTDATTSSTTQQTTIEIPAVPAVETYVAVPPASQQSYRQTTVTKVRQGQAAR